MCLRINAFALTGRTNDNTIIPRVSLRLPWAMRSLGFQPVCMSERMVRNTLLPWKQSLYCRAWADSKMDFDKYEEHINWSA
mgnify:FL=1